MGLTNLLPQRARGWHLFKVTLQRRARFRGWQSSLQDPTPVLPAKPGKSLLRWGRRAEGPTPPLSPCRCVYWGGRLPSSCVSARHTHLAVIQTVPHRPAIPAHWHLPVHARTDPHTSPSPALRAAAPTPSPERTQWPQDASTPPHPPRRDVTWGRALRHSTGGAGKGRRQSSLSRDSHSLSGRWGRAQTARPPPPHPLARLARPRKRRLTALRWGGLPGTPASRSQPAAPPGPPYPLEAPGVVAGGALGNSPDPCARRCPVRLPAPPPRGRCPGALPHGAGRRAPSALGAVTRVGAVCRSRPDPRGSCAVAPGSLVQPGCEPPTPGPSRPARHGQHPPLPQAAAPTSAPAAARALRAPVLPPAAGCRRAQVSPHLMPRPPGELGPPAKGAAGASAGPGDPGRREGQCRRRVLVPSERQCPRGRGLNW